MTALAPWQPSEAEVEKWANQGRTAKTHWAWTELTESLRGIAYSADQERRAGQPVWEMYRKTCPALWVEMGWAREADEP